MIAPSWLAERGMVPCSCGNSYKRTSGPWMCGVGCKSIGRGEARTASGVAPAATVARPAPSTRKGKAAEDAMAAQIEAAGYECVRELRFAPPRRWRFDVAVPSRMVAVEVDGGAFTGGHSRGTAYERECEKYGMAAAMGWRVVRCTPRMVKDGRALALVRAVVEGKR